MGSGRWMDQQQQRLLVNCYASSFSSSSLLTLHTIDLRHILPSALHSASGFRLPISFPFSWFWLHFEQHLPPLDLYIQCISGTLHGKRGQRNGIFDSSFEYKAPLVLYTFGWESNLFFLLLVVLFSRKSELMFHFEDASGRHCITERWAGMDGKEREECEESTVCRFSARILEKREKERGR